MCRVIAVANQKGGVGKTTTCVNLGIGLAREGKKVLLIEADAQGSMAVSLGIQEPDELDETLVNIMEKLINDKEPEPGEGIIHHEEGVDFIPANIELAGLETSLVNVMSREMVLRQYICGIKKQYDYILIDCMPSLGMITINALVAADRVLIPVEAAYLPVKGLQQLIKTIGRVKKQPNPKLKIEGILLTMVDNRTNYARDISLMVYDTYSSSIKVFGTEIPMSVRASEVSVEREKPKWDDTITNRMLHWSYTPEQKEEVKKALAAGVPKATILTYFYPEVTVEKMRSYRKKQ